MLRLKSLRSVHLPELSTTNEKSLAPVYRGLFLLAAVAPLGPSLMTLVYPEAPFFKLVTQVYFAPCQGAVAILLVSRLDKPFFPKTEKAAYLVFMSQPLLQGVLRLRVGRTLVGLSLIAIFLLYKVVYKILRRLRKRLALMDDEVRACETREATISRSEDAFIAQPPLLPSLVKADNFVHI